MQSINVFWIMIGSMALCHGKETAGNLSCYQCEVKDNALCTEDYLKVCPKDQAYDRCMTTISKDYDKIWIEKMCALAPCVLPSDSLTAALGLDTCDTSADKYKCVMCCTDNGCNFGRGSSISPDYVTIFSTILLMGAVITSTFHFHVSSLVQ